MNVTLRFYLPLVLRRVPRCRPSRPNLYRDPGRRVGRRSILSPSRIAATIDAHQSRHDPCRSLVRNLASRERDRRDERSRLILADSLTANGCHPTYKART